MLPLSPESGAWPGVEVRLARLQLELRLGGF